jgi:lipopolysaccharide/colanic/teichoic acid biosynthesis glycosyltransferase
MVKRLTDIVISVVLLAAASPVLVIAMLLVWAQDGRSPLYLAVRVGRNGRDFRMAKLRTMVVDAERKGGASTGRSDARITPLGAALRRCKLDELPQLFNVLSGDMSLVGPRPNTRRGGVDHYTKEEMRLLTVRPGITDLSSIVFSDEGDILDGAPDPDALYDAVIRPWKSRLGLLYVERRSFALDLKILWLTALAIAAKPLALRGIDATLAAWGAGEQLRRVCRRREPPPRGEPPMQAA